MTSAGGRARRWVTSGLVALSCAAVALAGCDSGGSTEATPSSAPIPAPEFSGDSSTSGGSNSSSSTAATRASAGSATGSATSKVPAGTTTSAKKRVGNPLFPLQPGFQSVRQGFVTKGGRRLPHRMVLTVTDVTKVVDGVRTLVALDQDFDGGELAEQSIDLFALDRAASVIYLGSYTERYEGGQFVNSTDAWLSGVGKGRWGILLPGAPKVGAPPFTQAVVPGEGAATAKVVKTGQRTCVPFRCFNGVVVLEENGSELKYFAPGAGGILTKPLSGDPQETEELINVTTLTGPGLAELSAEAMALDRHARAVSASVYGKSAPARRNT